MKLLLLSLSAMIAQGQTFKAPATTFEGAVRMDQALSTRPFRAPGSASSGACSLAYEVRIHLAIIYGCVSGTWTRIGGGTLITSSTPTSTSDTEYATPGFVQAAIDLKTVTGGSSADAYRVGRMNSTGTVAELAPRFTTFVPITFDGNGGVITAGGCQSRYVVAGGTITSIHIHSYNPNTTPPVSVSGTATVQAWSSPGTGSTTYTSIGTTTLTSASSMLDTTLTGWTTPIAASTTITACITGTPSSILKMTATLGVQ